MSNEPVYCNVPYNSSAPESKTTGQETWSPAQTPEKTEHRYQPQHCAIVFLSLTCVFLLAGIIALCVCYYFTAEQLRKDQTLLDEILQFHNFPVKQYCSKERKCSRCPTGWTFNNSKCYFVYLDSPWKSWKDSRLECIKMGADLLTIQNEEEQVFIMNFAPTYYDRFHGYWIGLTGKAQDWVWIDGSSLSSGFWADDGSQSHTHVLTNTGHKNKTTNSWRSAKPDMHNRWICENKALLF